MDLINNRNLRHNTSDTKNVTCRATNDPSRSYQLTEKPTGWRDAKYQEKPPHRHATLPKRYTANHPAPQRSNDTPQIDADSPTPTPRLRLLRRHGARSKLPRPPNTLASERLYPGLAAGGVCMDPRDASIPRGGAWIRP